MHTVAVVFGYGPNNVKIPLLVFETEEDARRYLAIHNVPVGEYLPEDLPKNIKDALFKNGYYYGGCGACHTISIATIPTGKPMVCWDLD